MKGYLKSEVLLPSEGREMIRAMWDQAQREGKTIILPKGIDFVPLSESALDPSIVICGHCGQWAARQTKCGSCGAPVY